MFQNFNIPSFVCKAHYPSHTLCFCDAIWLMMPPDLAELCGADVFMQKHKCTAFSPSKTHGSQAADCSIINPSDECFRTSQQCQ